LQRPGRRFEKAAAFVAEALEDHEFDPVLPADLCPCPQRHGTEEGGCEKTQKKVAA
jgi:hypothetical protein